MAASAASLHQGCPGAQARLEHATIVGQQQRKAEEEERAKMVKMAEHMDNEAAQQEGEVRRRHEVAMTKLALQREEQVSWKQQKCNSDIGHFLYQLKLLQEILL